MHDFYRVCFDEDFVGDVLLAMTEKYKTIIKLTSFATLQTAKSIINNSVLIGFLKQTHISMGGTMSSVGGTQNA